MRLLALVIFLALIWLLLSCANGSVPGKKVNIVLKNDGPHPIQFRASAGIFSRTIKLNPGQSWEGWVLRDWVGKDVVIRIRRGP